MKTNKIYQAPTIERAIVELEGGFCGSIDENGKNAKVETTGHEIHSATDVQINDWNTHSWD